VRHWALNLAVPLVAAALTFAAIAHAQAHQLDYQTRPRAACSPAPTDATVGYYGAITTGPAGDLFVAESRAQCVVRIDSAGVGHYAVGGGGRTGCPACGARVGFPTDVEVTPDGTVHVIDQGHYQMVGVRPDGTTTIERGAQRSAQVQALSQGRDGRLYAGDYEFVSRLDQAGWVVVAGGGRGELQLGAALQATTVRLGQITSLAVGPDNSLYIVERPLYRVLRVDPSGMLTVFAGTGLEGDSGDGGPATGANIYPDGVAVDDAGNVYISSQLHHRVRRVDKAGTITNFAGQPGTLPYGSGYGDGRPATEALLRFPTDMAWRDGNLYILDSYRVRKVDRSGIMTTVAGG